MLTIRLASLAVFLAIPSAAFAQDTPVLLTVIGEIAETNRGGLDDQIDLLAGTHGVDFDGAFTFDTAALAALPQASVTAHGPSWDGPITATGPQLDAVLDAVGAAAGATVTLQALDGYNAHVTAEDRAAVTWVLASHIDDAPLAIGGAGPLWALPDSGPDPVEEGGASTWVWGTYLLIVE